MLKYKNNLTLSKGGLDIGLKVGILAEIGYMLQECAVLKCFNLSMCSNVSKCSIVSKCSNPSKFSNNFKLFQNDPDQLTYLP